MPEVAWLPALTDRPTAGAWVMALCGDGVIVEEGMIGCVVGESKGVPVVRWTGDHQCRYPIRHLTAVDRPGKMPWRVILAGTSWAPTYTSPEPWEWLIGSRAVAA